MSQESDLLDMSGFCMVVNSTTVIDASKESGLHGRLISHARGKHQGQNCRLKTVVDSFGKLRVAILAKYIIEPGTRLAYDYGDRRAAAVAANAWLGTFQYY